MNKHFDDSRYYLARATEHARLGAIESLEAPLARVRTLLGRNPEPEPEPGRVDTVLAEAAALERRAETRARAVVGSVQGRVATGRSSEPDGDR